MSADDETPPPGATRPDIPAAPVPSATATEPAEGVREALGRLVRETWIKWAAKQPDPKPSWLTGWDELDGGQREVDMLIGHAVANYALTENAVTWDTSCTSCARVLDSAYAETVRREVAEAKLDEIRRTIAAFFTHHGNSASFALQSARDLGEGIRQVLDRTALEALGGGEKQERSDEKESP